jgi:hypothetical protein
MKQIIQELSTTQLCGTEGQAVNEPIFVLIQKPEIYKEAVTFVKPQFSQSGTF